MSRVKLFSLIAFLLILLLAYLLFPPQEKGSSVFYLSLFFLLLAFALSSKGKGLQTALPYLRLSYTGSMVPLLGWSAVAFAGSILATAAISVAAYYLGFLDTDSVAKAVVQLPPLSLLVAFTLAPLSEEALFRGYIFRKIKEFSGGSQHPAWIPAALVSSALFAALHIAYGSVSEILVAFAIGVILCVVTDRSESLLPSVLAHASFNLLSILYVSVL